MYNNLPYLAKIVSVEKPLSLQVHPDKEQAKIKFLRENKLGIPIDSPQRCYRDPNYKIEYFIALTPFSLLCGFSKIEVIISLLEDLDLSTLKSDLLKFKNNPNEIGLRQFFVELFTKQRSHLEDVVKESINNSKNRLEIPQYYWLNRLYEEYLCDPGVLSPLFLNFLRLEPKQGFFIPSRAIHTYLDGLGLELMTNSDNVIRCGLTYKSVDIPEIKKFTNFNYQRIKILYSKSTDLIEEKYPIMADEFAISTIRLKETMGYKNFECNSVEILFCLEGKFELVDMIQDVYLFIKKGNSVFIPACVSKYSIKGNGVLYRTYIPTN
jgi:mannose-6-phosphate isomerase